MLIKPLVIVCIKCVQQMTGLVSDGTLRYAHNEAISSEMIEPMTPGQVGEWCKEMRNHAQLRMMAAEKLIAAATWACENA